MEADLSQYHQTDYTDRWRTDEHDRPRLTLRKIAVLVRHLPVDSAVVRTYEGWTAWRIEHALLDDIRMTVQASIPAKKAPKIQTHPDRPKAMKPPPTPAQVRARNAAKKRAAERRRKIAAGEIT